jgi:hypothetical protein
MHVYVYVCMPVYYVRVNLSIYILVCGLVCTCELMCGGPFARVYMHTHACMRVCMCICLDVYVCEVMCPSRCYAHLQIFVYLYLHVCMLMCIDGYLYACAAVAVPV